MPSLLPAVHRGIYLANATVLLAHQIEAAYWEEWTLFRLPGGVQFFVVLNVPISMAVLIGFERLRLRSGRRLSALLAGSGLFAATFHTAHLLAGDDAFRTPVSVGLLALTALLSPLQLLALRATRAADEPGCAEARGRSRFAARRLLTGTRATAPQQHALVSESATSCRPRGGPGPGRPEDR